MITTLLIIGIVLFLTYIGIYFSTEDTWKDKVRLGLMVGLTLSCFILGLWVNERDIDINLLRGKHKISYRMDIIYMKVNDSTFVAIDTTYRKIN